MTPNKQQRRIIDKPIDAKVKVVAGAGTGKTGVLVERYLKFVLDDGVDPDHLLALTFTKKAAAEMQGRIFAEVAKRGDHVTLRSLYGAWIMNFHQFAFRVIKEHAARFGIDPDIVVASEVDLERTWRGVRKAFEGGAIAGLPGSYGDDMPPPNRMEQYFDRCKDVVDKARGTMWTPESLLATAREDDVPEYHRYVQTVVAVWRAYESGLRDQQLLDFNDLIRIVVDELGSNDTLRDVYRKRFAHILVDEFQDTSEGQNELLRLLAGEQFPHTTVVGDEKQSIYRWRDARVENIREFRGEEEPLTLNYRSTQGILDAAFHLIAGDPYFGKAGETFHLQSARGKATAPICVFHPEDASAPSPELEAASLAAWIIALTAERPPDDGPFAAYAERPPRLGFGDIAVLMRSLKPASGLPHYERELQRVGVPYAIVGGVSALEAGVLELFKNVLRLLIFPADTMALLAVLEAAPFRVSDEVLTLMFRGAKRPHLVWSHSPVFQERGLLSDAVLDHVENDDARARIVALRDFLATLDYQRSQMDLATFITEALGLTQFYYRLFDEGGDVRLVGSLSRRIFELIEQLIQKGEPNLAAFIEAVETLLTRKQFGEEDAPYVPEGRVIIMTQHQAKGLQFPAVAVPGIKRQRGKSDGFYLVKGEGIYATAAKDWGRGTSDTNAADVEKLEREQEERCLLYVAMTRARDHLFLSTPFANGTERAKKKNLFASLLEALHGGDIDFVERREAPPAQPIESREDVAVAGEDLRSLIDEWQRGRERLQEARAGVIPTPEGLRSVSWRGLLAFERCPLQFYYRYIAGVTDDLSEEDAIDTEAARAPGGLLPAEFGSFVHRFLFEWIGAGKGEARALLVDLAGRYGLPPAARDPVVEAATSIATAYEPHVDAAAVARLEWPVRRRVGGLMFHGVIDRVDRVDGGYRIVDYKVGSPRPDYAHQIAFYAWLGAPRLDGPVEGGAVAYLQDGATIDEMDLSRIDAVETAAAELSEAVADGIFHANPGRVCEECEFHSVCPYSVATDGTGTGGC